MFKAAATVSECKSVDGRVTSLHVDTKWTCTDPKVKLDRTDCMGYGLDATHRKLAERLVKAIEAGVVFPNPKLAVDVRGRTYVSCGLTVVGRRMNADLCRLGF